MKLAAVRRAIGLVVVCAAVTLSVPASVAACLCGGESQGDVVFTGTVMDSPNGAILLPELFVSQPGVYTFDVQSVIRGDPLDGRVYSGHGSCNSFFELGATYRVHAWMAGPGEDYLGNPSDVPLATDMCMAGELLEPASPLIVIRAVALSPLGAILIISGLMLMAVVGVSLRRRRTTSAGEPAH